MTWTPLDTAIALIAPMQDHRLYEASVRALASTYSRHGETEATNHALRIRALWEDAELREKIDGGMS